jgi:beta-glucosidase
MLAMIALLAMQPQAPDSVESRVEDALSKMTVEEKIDIISGVDGFYERGVPRLSIPRLKMSDGPVGVRNDGPTTAYPAGICLASTFDPDLAKRFGVAIGRDARARGVHIWLGPGTNISRIPQNGRDFEYVGEDPFLAGQSIKSIVQGVQSQGVVATVKHFAANNHENDRMTDSADVDERTLHEIYLRSFETAVKEGGAWAVMCSYNKLNGTYAAENKWLLQTVLKDEWGFKGVVMSDWGAVHSTLPTALNGLDLEMPGGQFLNRRTLTPLLQAGELGQAVLDDKVRRILRLTYAMNFDSQTQLDSSIPRDDPQNAAVALQIAREGTVLLRNRNHLLPLDRTKLKKILVVGPDADPAITGGGGSAYTQPFHALSVLQAIKQAAGSNVDVQYLPAIGSSLTSALSDTKFDGPIKAEYWNGQSTEGTPEITRDESSIDFDWSAPDSRPFPGTTGMSARWTASVTVPKPGAYLLMLKSRGALHVEADGKTIADVPGNFVPITDSEPVKFSTAGRHELKIVFHARRGNGVVQVALVPLDGAIDRALPPGVVESADAVVAAVGFNPGSESEGRDRPFALPYAQEMLLKAITARSPNVIVLNHSGAGVDMSAWVDKTGAVLQDWYPGENGNQAVAEILFGDTNPSGKLAVTFPRVLADTYYATAYPPKDHHLAYTEGLLVGYRWFDTKNQKPLFPFGYGLSYTSFKLSGFEASADGDGILAHLKVKNTGRVAGTETVQLYVGKSDSAIPRAARELKAFQRVDLQPGETKTVELRVPAHWVAYWNVQNHAWEVEPGKYQIYVGTSSSDLTIRSTINLAATQ